MQAGQAREFLLMLSQIPQQRLGSPGILLPIKAFATTRLCGTLPPQTVFGVQDAGAGRGMCSEQWSVQQEAIYIAACVVLAHCFCDPNVQLPQCRLQRACTPSQFA